MKNFEELIKEARQFGLGSDEKNSLREKIFNFVHEHPVRKWNSVRHIQREEENSSQWLNVLFPNFRNLIPNLRLMPIILVLTMLLGAGVSFGAEGALPGDPFYPVKVNVNEKVVGWLSLSQEARADWEARLASRRLEEAEKLAVDGRLNAENKNKIEANFDAHAERVKERVEEMEEKRGSSKAANVSSNFEVSLQAHERILARLAEDDGEEVEDLALSVKAHKDAFVKIRTKAEATFSAEADSKTEARAAAEGRLKAAENKIAEVKQFIVKMKEKLGEKAVVEAETRINAPEDLVAEGKLKLQTEAYGEAFVLFQRAHRIAQEAKLLIEARKELNLEVRIPAVRFNANHKSDAEAEAEIEGDENQKSGTTLNSSAETEVESETKVETDNGNIEGGGGIRLKLGL